MAHPRARQIRGPTVGRCWVRGARRRGGAGRREAARRGAGLGTLSLSFRFFAERRHPRCACALSSRFSSSPGGSASLQRAGGGESWEPEGAERTVGVAAADASATGRPSSLPSLSREVRRELVVILRDLRGTLKSTGEGSQMLRGVCRRPDGGATRRFPVSSRSWRQRLREGERRAQPGVRAEVRA